MAFRQRNVTTAVVIEDESPLRVVDGIAGYYCSGYIYRSLGLPQQPQEVNDQSVGTKERPVGTRHTTAVKGPIVRPKRRFGSSKIKTAITSSQDTACCIRRPNTIESEQNSTVEYEWNGF